MLDDRSRVQLWDAATGLPVGPPLEHADQEGGNTDLSADGRTVLTVGWNGEAWLRDAATGRLLGPPLKHQHGIQSAKFSPDGRIVLTGCVDGTARLWDVAEWPNEWAPAITLRIEALTGMTLDDRGEVRYLDTAGWSERLDRLASVGIPHSQPPRWSFDPIVYGSEPTARANAWIERGRWAEAEAELERAVNAQPENTQIRLERARFFARRTRPEEAAAEYGQALFINVMHDLLPDSEKSHGVSSGGLQPLAASERARAALSNEILTDRAIADRVCALVPKDLFQLLHPLVRARYLGNSGSLERRRGRLRTGHQRGHSRTP
ncbi:MAG: WD40 repeat domain-containing protein [Isosphaerales bacterium]